MADTDLTPRAAAWQVILMFVPEPKTLDLYRFAMQWRFGEANARALDREIAVIKSELEALVAAESAMSTSNLI